jgi:hypothetical protein
MRRALAAPLILTLIGGCSQEDTAGTGAMEDPSGSTSSGPVAERVHLRLANAMAGWVPSGMTVAAGDNLALFGSGQLEAAGVWEPRHLLWYRIGEDGDANQFAANLELVSAQTDGQLYLTLRPAGILWTDRRGTYPDGFTSAPAVPTDLGVELVRLNGNHDSALRTMAAAGETQAQALLDSLAARNSLPEGFDYLWFLSRANVWADGAGDGRPGISADTSDDFGIVKRPLDLPLNEATRFRFDWRYNAVPARGPETLAEHHDYLSIALEFDNGQDLTWMWSAELPQDTHFACPLPGWENRETHWVLQTGAEGVGGWYSHDRPVLEDYRASIDGEPPSRIVGIWFIANSVFGRQRGAASFAEVTIANGESEFRVF